MNIKNSIRNQVRERGGAPSMETIGSYAVVMGFSPISSHVATAPITFHHHSSSEHHGPRTMRGSSWNTDQGPISLKCVSIVARLRQNEAEARCREGVAMFILRHSRCREGVAICPKVSRFSGYLCHYVAGRLESFYYRAHIALKCDILSTIATPSRHLEWR